MNFYQTYHQVHPLCPTIQILNSIRQYWINGFRSANQKHQKMKVWNLSSIWLSKICLQLSNIRSCKWSCSNFPGFSISDRACSIVAEFISSNVSQFDIASANVAFLLFEIILNWISTRLEKLSKTAIFDRNGHLGLKTVILIFDIGHFGSLSAGRNWKLFQTWSEKKKKICN